MALKPSKIYRIAAKFTIKIIPTIKGDLLRHQQNNATHIRQRGNPSVTTRRRIPQAHLHHNEVGALYHPFNHGMSQPTRPSSISYQPSWKNNSLKKIAVEIPNGVTIITTKECTLTLPQLPKTAIEGNILAGLTYSSLIPIGNMCDAGFR